MVHVALPAELFLELFWSATWLRAGRGARQLQDTRSRDESAAVATAVLFINGEGSYPVVGDAIEFDISDFCQVHLIFSQMSPGILSAAYYRH